LDTGFHRSLLPISSVSLLGTCETRFMESIEGRQKVTKQMKVGKAMHERLAAPLPKITFGEVVEKIKSGGTGAVRELPVTDGKYKLIGRIDQLELLGSNGNGRNRGIITDDKYPKRPYTQMPMYQKLQLAAYAAAVGHSDKLSNICEVVGVRLIHREAVTHKIMGTFGIEGKELDNCEVHVETAAGTAWELYNKKKEPEHRRFDVGSGEWVGCYCNTF
jgi:hypothetical protein